MELLGITRGDEGFTRDDEGLVWDFGLMNLEGCKLSVPTVVA